MRPAPIVFQLWCVRPQLPKEIKERFGGSRYGSYPAGIDRVRIVMGVHISDPVLHVCAGLSRWVKWGDRLVGPNDRTMDLDPRTEPDYLQDAREPWPTHVMTHGVGRTFKAVIADPDYTEADALQAQKEGARTTGPETLPTPAELLERAYEVLEPGRRFGILHTKVPSVKEKLWRFVAKGNVSMGGNNDERVFCVFEKR